MKRLLFREPCFPEQIYDSIAETHKRKSAGVSVPEIEAYGVKEKRTGEIENDSRRRNEKKN